MGMGVTARREGQERRVFFFLPEVTLQVELGLRGFPGRGPKNWDPSKSPKGEGGAGKELGNPVWLSQRSKGSPETWV